MDHQSFWQQWKFKIWVLPFASVVGLAFSIGAFIVIGLAHDLRFMDYVGFGFILLLSLFFAWQWISELRAYRKGMKNPRTRPFLTEWTRK